MRIKSPRLRHTVAAWLSVALLATAALPVAAARVATVLAQPGAGAGQRSLDGSLQPLRQATLAAQLGGNVLQLAVKAGDHVRSGQLVARVDERDAQAALARSDAGLVQAEAEARNARQAVERQRSLRAQGFVSQAALDQAETQSQAAQAGVLQARAGRSQAVLQRSFSVITAPFDGVVLATHLDAGDLAAPGRAIATLYAPGALRAVVQVPASLAGEARTASGVQVALPDGQRVTPVVRSLLPGADPVSQTVEWRLDLPAGIPSLLPGQAVRVYFQGAASSGASAVASPPLLPASAVLRRGELTAVYAVRDQRFVLRAVRTGADRGAAGIEVLAGLKPGERVAVDAVAAGLAGAVPAP